MTGVSGIIIYSQVISNSQFVTGSKFFNETALPVRIAPKLLFVTVYFGGKYKCINLQLSAN